MDEAENKLGLDKSLNFVNHKYSFEVSSLVHPKPSQTDSPQLVLDLGTLLKEPSRANHKEAQDVLHLDDVFQDDNRQSPEPNPQNRDKRIKEQHIDGGLKKNNNKKTIPPNLNNNSSGKQITVIQREDNSEKCENSGLLGSSHLSSYMPEEGISMREIQENYDTFDLQGLIDKAKPCEKIQLPSQTVKVQKLVIDKPLILQGSISSILEISDSISINLSEYPVSEKNKVAFLECTIKFQYSSHKDTFNQSTASKKSFDARLTNKKDYSEQYNQTIKNPGLTTQISESRIYPLFRIQANSRLEVLDCKISSHNPKQFQDVCFYLEHPSHNQSRSFVGMNIHPSLYLQSTYICNFQTALQNNMLGKIYMEKTYIANNSGHALNISNPFILQVKECTIEQIQRSCINIRFSFEMTLSLSRSVLIQDNKLIKGASYGISIFGENLSSQMCDINIIGNQINGFEKDGICVKNLNICKLRIEKNSVSNNKRNGISLQNIVDTVSFEQVKLIENKISQSQLYGLVVTDVLFYSDRDEIFENAKAGVLFSGASKSLSGDEKTFYRKYPLRNILISSNIYYNKESGITIVGNLKGPITLTSCKIHDNTNGVYIKQASLGFDEREMLKVSQHSPALHADPMLDGDGVSHLLFDRCMISQNEISGIHIKGISTKAYLKDSLIYDNKNYAVFIQNENEKNFLVFKEKDKHKIREYISGYIGGSWGVLFEPKRSGCKGGCNIF